MNHPIITSHFQINFQRSTGVIALYGGDKNTTVESMASSLSHEYGHHYTFSHMFSADDNAVTNSAYAKLRKLPKDLALTDRSDSQFYYDNHHRFLVEIAAEDYVTLMGSPTTRSVVDYSDVRDTLNGHEGERDFGRNARVQENLTIPMAQEVKGLSDYFYQFIKKDPTEFAEKQAFTPRIDSYMNSFDLDTGYEEFWSYDITWDKVYGEDAVYTLVCYDPQDYADTLSPVKTVFSGERAMGTVGRVAYESGNRIYYSWDELAQGTRVFVVTVILPDGTMQLSQPLSYTF